jgi:hypothetical protein
MRPLGNCSGGLDTAIGDAVRGGLRVFDLVGRSGLKQVKLIGEDAMPLIEPPATFHAVSNRRETVNTLIKRENCPSVSPFHDFWERVTAHSNHADRSPKTVKR